MTKQDTATRTVDVFFPNLDLPPVRYENVRTSSSTDATEGGIVTFEMGGLDIINADGICIGCHAPGQWAYVRVVQP